MDGNIPSPEKTSEWLNLNSIMARMTSEGLADLSLLALWEIRGALEKENGSKAAANCNISAASQWVIISGTQLYNEVLKASPLNEHQAKITKGGPCTMAMPAFPKVAGNFGSCDLRMKWIRMSQKWPNKLHVRWKRLKKAEEEAESGPGPL